MTESSWFFTSIFSRRSLSASALASASFTIFSISVSDNPVESVMVIFCSLPVPLSLAPTFRMPFASISKVTSICGIPRGAGGIPSRWNFPIDRLSLAISRSPWMTLTSTDGWLSAAVENVSAFRVGMVVFRSIRRVVTPPMVSIPNDRGVTSNNKISFTSPERTPAWTAAPRATTSSGLTPWWGSLPNKFLTSSCALGILVEPPTRTASWTWSALIPASFMAWTQGFLDFSIRSSTIDSNLDRESLMFKCLGPDASAVMNGRLISVSLVVESSILAFSAASFKRCKTILSFERSTPWSFLNSATSQSMIRWSKLSPPRWVSPWVALTSTTLSPTSRIETSKVPPPKSYTAMVWSLFLSRP